MIFPQNAAELFYQVIPIQLSSNIFQKVNDILPENQVPIWITRETPIKKAFKIMKENDFSQLPVKAGNEILGIFSYRSFSTKFVEEYGKFNQDTIPVGEYLDQTEFIDVFEDISKSLEILNKNEVLLIGRRRDFKGLITPIDLVNYIYKLSSPFIIISEIENAIRWIINVCTTPTQLTQMIRNSLKIKYENMHLPSSIQEMSFKDYELVIGDGRNWSAFEPVFGETDYMRQRIRGKLFTLNNLRNDIFHFRRELLEEDIVRLSALRDWLEAVIKAFHEECQGGDSHG